MAVDLLEIDDVVVEKALWAKILRGDKDAIAQLRKQLDGIELYMHLFSFDPNIEYECVTLRELQEQSIIERVSIKAYTF